MPVIPATTWTANSTVPYADQSNQDGLRGAGGLIGSDDFESYVNDQVLTNEVQAGLTWIGGRKATNVFANGGSLSMDMHYNGDPDFAAQASNEMRFELDQLYTELTIEFDLYIPSNYEHRLGTTGVNNKFLRIWATIYDSYEKTGYSTLRQAGDDSTIGSDKIGSAISSGAISTGVTQSPNFILAADHGSWMAIKIELSAPKAAAEGFSKIYKDGSLLITENLLVNNNQTGDQPGYRYGYLMGYANSGFTNDTLLCIDNVVFTSGVS